MSLGTERTQAVRGFPDAFVGSYVRGPSGDNAGDPAVLRPDGDLLSGCTGGTVCFLPEGKCHVGGRSEGSDAAVGV